MGMKKSFFTGTLTPETLSTWTKDWLAGKVTPTLKSAQAPHEQDNKEEVKIVVGSTFKNEVLQSGKDTMVEFHAPWCGHCKQFAGAYSSIARALAEIKTIQLVKIDATENEIDEVEVKGFPTFYFFKASDPSKPILYEGERSEEEMTKFIKENADLPSTDVDASHKEDGEL